MNYLGQLLIGILLFANSTSIAQSTPDSQFKLEGRVLNAITGRPIPRALVQLNSASPQYVLSGPNGEFSFSHLQQGAVYVMITKPGFFPPGRANRNGSLQATMTQVGSDTPALEMKLMPESVISGQVMGNNGEPVEGAEVEVSSLVVARGLRQIVPVSRRGFGAGWGGGSRSIRTDEEGNYRVAGLPPGSYYVAVKSGNLFRRPGAPASSASAKGPGNSALPPIVYHPGVTDFDSAMPVQLSGGQHVAVDFSLKEVPAYKVSGTVTGPREWKSIQPPIIIDETDQVLFSPDKFDGDTGAFEFKALPAGSYTVRLTGSDQNHGVLTAIRRMTVDGPTNGLKFSMAAAQDIPVIVRKQLSKAAVRAMQCSTTGPDGQTRTTDCSDFPAVTVQLRSTDGHSAGSAGFGQENDPNNIKVKGVMPGKYLVRVYSRLGGYVESVRSGALDLMREELVVPDEGSVAPIEVTLRDDGGAVKIHLNGGPSQSGWAVLLPDLFSRDPVVLDIHSGSDRDYSGLPPGTYQVLAFDSLDGIDTNSPELLEKYSEKATHITLSANSSTTVSVDLIKPEE